MRPEWIIYKNEERIGQAVTWHRALDIVVKQEGLFHVDLWLSDYEVKFRQDDVYYKIIKER